MNVGWVRKNRIYGGVAQTTRNAYTPDDQLATLTVVFPDESKNQITTFVYGTTTRESDIASNRLLASKVYADGTADGYRYNRQGQVTRKADPNTTIHQYLYDGLGRLQHDRVVQFGPDIATTTQRQSYAYDATGRIAVIDACSSADPTVPSVANEVALGYDGFGALISHAQDHDGKVKSTSAVVLYERSEGTDNHDRITRITYPSGKVIRLHYGEADTANDLLGRVETVFEEATPDDLVVAGYTYLGLDVTVRVDYPDADAMLDLWGGTVGDYTGIDRFGRIIDHRWKQSDDTDLVRLLYGYDRDGRRLYRKDAIEPPTDGLVAEYLFAPGEELADSSGNGNDLTNDLGVTFTGGVATFTSGGLAAGSSVAATGDFTLSAWIKTTEEGAIFGEHSSDWSEGTFCFNLWSGGGVGNSLIGWVKDAADALWFVHGSANIQDGEWHQVALRLHGETLSVWVDGVLDVNVVMPGFVRSTPTDPAPLHLGAGWDTSLYPFVGQMKRAMVWDRGLTDAEMAALVLMGPAATNRDELYSYDGIGQLLSLDRGVLEPDYSGLVPGTEVFGETFDFDAIGNWSHYTLGDPP